MLQISPKTDNNVMFRIWARKDAIDQVEYAKIIGPKILRFFETFFDVPYPLPKQVEKSYFLLYKKEKKERKKENEINELTRVIFNFKSLT